MATVSVVDLVSYATDYRKEPSKDPSSCIPMSMREAKEQRLIPPELDDLYNLALACPTNTFKLRHLGFDEANATEKKSFGMLVLLPNDDVALVTGRDGRRLLLNQHYEQRISHKKKTEQSSRPAKTFLPSVHHRQFHRVKTPLNSDGKGFLGIKAVFDDKDVRVVPGLKHGATQRSSPNRCTVTAHETSINPCIKLAITPAKFRDLLEQCSFNSNDSQECSSQKRGIHDVWATDSLETSESSHGNTPIPRVSSSLMRGRNSLKDLMASKRRCTDSSSAMIAPMNLDPSFEDFMDDNESSSEIISPLKSVSSVLSPLASAAQELNGDVFVSDDKERAIRVLREFCERKPDQFTRLKGLLYSYSFDDLLKLLNDLSVPSESVRHGYFYENANEIIEAAKSLYHCSLSEENRRIDAPNRLDLLGQIVENAMGLRSLTIL